MALDITFWILAAASVVTALAVVSLSNVFRAALLLMVCFLAVAGLYATLSADFLAVAQILIYVGGISILIILAIMLTRDVQRGSPANRLRLPALVVVVLFFGLVTFALVSSPWAVSGQAPQMPTTATLADKLFGSGGFILAVEIAGVLLLAAVVGAIVLVREK
ncbi:MAG: NADH-quinone oxidoreductase subunit J [Chloroflexota bacterium]